jgi:hypothetical protein
MSSLPQNIAITVATGLLVMASNMASAQVKLQTNPNLLVAYPYFSIKFLSSDNTHRVNSSLLVNQPQALPNTTRTLATPSTDSEPFTLSEIAYYEVVSGGHGFGLSLTSKHSHKLNL